MSTLYYQLYYIQIAEKTPSFLFSNVLESNAYSFGVFITFWSICNTYLIIYIYFILDCSQNSADFRILA